MDFVKTRISHGGGLRRTVKRKTRFFVLLLSLFISYGFVKLLKTALVSHRLEKIETNKSQLDWQIVEGSDEIFIVYSAYYVQNQGPNDNVRVIGATKTNYTNPVKCNFYDAKAELYTSVDATLRIMKENWNLEYSSYFVICPVNSMEGEYKQDQLPRYVSIVTKSISTSTNILPIQYPEEKIPSRVDFSVCVLPLFDYNNILPFLEWMVFHELMGVERFTFFNLTIGHGVSCIMKELFEDKVTVLPWAGLPPEFISEETIRGPALFAALNDCVYRHKGASEYLLIVDVDEMIVPRKGATNYKQMIQELYYRSILSNGRQTGAFFFQNAFFFRQWPDDDANFIVTSEDPLNRLVPASLLMLTKTWRKQKFEIHGIRSKYICIPDRIIEGGNHIIWEMSPGFESKLVPPNIAALHHYRFCGDKFESINQEPCSGFRHVVDKSAHVFSKNLIDVVVQKFELYTEKCQAYL